MTINKQKALLYLSKLVQEQMKTLHMTQEQFAAYSKISQGTISRLETCDYSGLPSFVIIEALAETQGQYVWQLIKDIEEFAEKEEVEFDKSKIIMEIHRLTNHQDAYEIASEALRKGNKLYSINH